METNNLHITYVDEELRCLLGQIANKWTWLVMDLLEQGPRRFTSLRRQIGDVSQKMLTQTLRDLERNGRAADGIRTNSAPRRVHADTAWPHAL
jgi:DNA-binding HxlR family transcriptional regulator